MSADQTMVAVLANGRRVRTVASRVSYRVFVGPIGRGLLICHRCDNPPCVNPDHLYAGTPKQNAEDMMRRGRYVPPLGDMNGNARPSELLHGFLDEYERRKGATSVAALSREFGIPRTTAQNWARGIYRSLERT